MLKFQPKKVYFLTKLAQVACIVCMFCSYPHHIPQVVNYEDIIKWTGHTYTIQILALESHDNMEIRGNTIVSHS